MFLSIRNINSIMKTSEGKKLQKKKNYSYKAELRAWNNNLNIHITLLNGAKHIKISNKKET